jgi:hypothetical protein
MTIHDLHAIGWGAVRGFITGAIEDASGPS